MADVFWRALGTPDEPSDDPAVLAVLDDRGVAMTPLATDDISLLLDALDDARVVDDIDGSTLNVEDEPPHDVLPCVGGEPGVMDGVPLNPLGLYGSGTGISILAPPLMTAFPGRP